MFRRSHLRRGGRRKRSRLGNAILESVFTLMPTFALICAFVDFSLMLFRWSTLQNAVREGTRYAITFQRNGSLGQDASIQGVVQQYAMGLVKTTDSPQHIFVRYYDTAAPNTPIGSGGNTPGNIVQVSVENISWAWLAPLAGGFGSGAAGTVASLRNTNPITLNVYSADILGGYPAGVLSVPR